MYIYNINISHKVKLYSICYFCVRHLTLHLLCYFTRDADFWVYHTNPHVPACTLMSYDISSDIKFVRSCPFPSHSLIQVSSSFWFLRPGDHPYASGIRRWIGWAGFPTKSDVRKIVQYVATCPRMPIFSDLLTGMTHKTHKLAHKEHSTR